MDVHHQAEGKGALHGVDGVVLGDLGYAGDKDRIVRPIHLASILSVCPVGAPFGK